MVSTREKRRSNRRLLSQLDDCDQDNLFGNAASESQENTVVNECSYYRDITVGTFSNNSATKENTMNVKTLERCLNEEIDRGVSKIVATVEYKI